jgi:sigma-E factor negative regulatory protein RseC
VGAEVGQHVKIGISSKALLKASMILYIIPVLTLIVGALVGNMLFAQQKEIGSFSFGVGFFVGSFVIIRQWGRSSKKKLHYVPRVTQILMSSSSSDYKENG